MDPEAVCSIVDTQPSGEALHRILGAMAVCDKLLALDLQISSRSSKGRFTDVPSIGPEGPVLLPSNLSYLRTNVPNGFVSAASVECVCSASLHVNLFANIQVCSLDWDPP